MKRLYFEYAIEIPKEGENYYENQDLEERLNELKKISERTGISLENVINYVGFNIISDAIEEMAEGENITYAINELKEAIINKE